MKNTQTELEQATSGGQSPLSAAARVDRNLAIVNERHSGASWRDIEQKFGLSERQLRNIYREWQSAGALDFGAENPRQVVFAFVERYRRIERNLALLAETADNTAAAVGANRAWMEAIDRQVDLMQSAGLLPRHLGQLEIEADVRMVAAKVVAVFKEQGVPAETTRAVVEALERAS